MVENIKKKPLIKKPQVNVKRQVIVKSVVTEGFKDYLNRELTDTVELYKKYIIQIDEQLKTIDSETPTAFKLMDEKLQYKNYIDSEQSQRKFVEDLEIDSLYSQGPVESLVSITVGDNLYEKLSALEIIVRDGIVDKITINKDFKPGMKIVS